MILLQLFTDGVVIFKFKIILRTRYIPNLEDFVVVEDIILQLGREWIDLVIILGCPHRPFHTRKIKQIMYNGKYEAILFIRTPCRSRYQSLF
jgi:hypothetical protein